MSTDDAEETAIPLDARRAIERAVWDWGVKGDSCAVFAHKIIESLHEAGFGISEQPQ